jgi:XTP/dITP diphosphohydrolase/tetrapyrrole methylase family protein/MazG family protein
LNSSAEVLVQWDAIKRTERQAAGKSEVPVFKPLPPQQPALLYAEAVWKQVEKKRLDGAVRVDRGEVRRLATGLTEETLGRRLFERAAAAQSQGLDPEGALRRETSRVTREAEAAWHAANPPAS